jgi:transcriptional regulator with XRE-family HTH domain
MSETDSRSRYTPDKDVADAVGDKLREVRQTLGLSLAAVESKSDGRWKAVVVGSYERGDRNITVARLVELAGWYGVAPAELLPAPPAGSEPRNVLVSGARKARAVADLLSRLAGLAGEDGAESR